MGWGEGEPAAAGTAPDDDIAMGTMGAAWGTGGGVDAGEAAAGRPGCGETLFERGAEGEVVCWRGCEGLGGWSVAGVATCCCCFCRISFMKACWNLSLVLK